jgi:hypothetical protein
MSGSSKGNTYMESTHDETTKTMTQARTDLPKTLPADGPPKPVEARPPSHRWRKLVLGVGAVGGLVVGGYLLRACYELQ